MPDFSIPAQASARYIPDESRQLHFSNGDYIAYVMNECVNKKLIIVIDVAGQRIARYAVTHMSECGYIETSSWNILADALEDFGTPIEGEPF